MRRATTRYPPRGYAELKAQAVSAAESIVFNIVEGCGASSQPEFARFLEVSIKSTKELEGELELASLYEILTAKDWQSLATQTIDTRRMLIGLRKKVLQLDPSKSISHTKRPAENAPLPSRPLQRQ